MKKSFFFIAVVLCLLFLCGCSESYSVETNQEFRLIENDCNDIVPFVQEIEEIVPQKAEAAKVEKKNKIK